MAEAWTNWAGNARCEPFAIERPASEEELVAVVERAAAGGRRVKVVGAGHSFTDIACTDGHLVDLARASRVVRVDRERAQVTVQAGIELRKLNRELARVGLALENLGDIAYQSVAGATQTATHGTGLRFGNLSSQIVGMRIVTGSGEVMACSAEENPEVFHAARVGVGALGAVSEITLQCVPAFNLHAVEEPMRVDEVLGALDDHVEGNDHFEFFWVPHTNWALTKSNRRTDEPASPRPRWQAVRDDLLYTNVLFGALCRLGRRRPSLAAGLGRRIPSSGRVEYVERSDRVFASPRYVHFHEMEYAVPREALAEAVQRVRNLVRDAQIPLLFPVEVRVVAGDDIPLSTAHGRETGYVAVHVYRNSPFDQYFTGVEAIMSDYGGRPHWGKMHFQRADTLAPLYPEWGRVQEVRARLDPEGRFANAYLDRVLGPIG